MLQNACTRQALVLESCGTGRHLLEIAETMFIHAVMSAVKNEISFGTAKATEVNPRYSDKIQAHY